jgi:ATP-dependent DNA ligase
MWLQALYNGDKYWQIGFDGENLVTRYGKINGKIRESKRKVYTNNSGRNLQEQALLEANQKFIKQMRKGYSNEECTITVTKPMLANEFDIKKIRAFPILVQPKIDGIRSIVDKTLTMRSKEGREQLYLHQIKEELSKLFQFIDCILDGELYVHGWEFTKLVSAIRTENVMNELNPYVCYYIFDIITDNMSAYDRYLYLFTAFENYKQTHGEPKYLYLLPTYTVNTLEELTNLHNIFVNNGYEGAMIRHTAGCNRNGIPLTTYRSTRCDNLLKYKMFKDEEGVIIDVIEENGTEKELSLFMIRDIRGNEFVVRPRGNFEQRKEWYRNRDRLIGKKYTFRYFELSEYGVPRFPIGVIIRDYE